MMKENQPDTNKETTSREKGNMRKKKRNEHTMIREDMEMRDIT